MPTRNWTKKAALFQRGAAAAARVLGTPPDLYPCPLCGRLYGQGSLNDGELTLEHVPPRSVGGQAIVLTCRECNSVAGHTVDAAVAGREAAYGFRDAVNTGQTDAVIQARLVVGGEMVNVTFGRDEGWGAITILPEQNDPAAVERVNEYLDRFDAGVAGEMMELTVRMRRGFHGGRALVGDLKAAYLLAFAVFGYTWAAHPSLAPVRAQIAEPEAAVLGQWWLNPDRVPERVVALADTRSEPSFRCVCVRLARTVVLLPWFETDDLYARAVAADQEPEGLRFGPAVRFPWPKTLDLTLDFLEGLQREELA